MVNMRKNISIKKRWKMGLGIFLFLSAVGSYIFWLKKGENLKETFIRQLPLHMQKLKNSTPELNLILKSGNFTAENIILSGFPFKWTFRFDMPKIFRFVDKESLTVSVSLKYLLKNFFQQIPIHIDYSWHKEAPPLNTPLSLFLSVVTKDKNKLSRDPDILSDFNGRAKIDLSLKKMKLTLHRLETSIKEGADLFGELKVGEKPSGLSFDMTIPFAKEPMASDLKIQGDFKPLKGLLPGFALSFSSNQKDKVPSMRIEHRFNAQTQELKTHMTSAIKEFAMNSILFKKFIGPLFEINGDNFSCVIHIKNQNIFLNNKPVKDFMIRRIILQYFKITKKYLS